MKILSYNIKAGGHSSWQPKEEIPVRFEGIRQVIIKQKVDLVSILEVYKWEGMGDEKKLKEVFGFKNIFQVSLDDESLGLELGMMVMTNLPVVSFETVRLFNRNAIKTVLSDKEIFSIHLDDKQEETRIEQINDLLKQINPNKPTVLIGDFNNIDRDDLQRCWYVYLLGLMEPRLWGMAKSKAIDLIKNYCFKNAGTSGEFSVPGKYLPFYTPPMLRVDQAFYSPEIEVEKFEVLNNKEFWPLSDHYPIVLEIK